MLIRTASVLFLLFAPLLAQAVKPAYPIVYSKATSFHLKQCSSDLDCAFSGSGVVTGHFTFGYDEKCETNEDDGCVSLEFEPDDPARLPHFDQLRQAKTISIHNDRKAATLLIGQDLMDKAIASGKAAVAAINAGQNPGTPVTIKGTATIKLGNYAIGISCDHAYANADVLAVRGKSQASVAEQAPAADPAP